jgi:YihY family inner membrane protein
LLVFRTKPLGRDFLVTLIERLARKVDQFQRRHTVIGFPWAVLQKFGNDQAGTKAALVAYYGLFALFPLLLLLTTILGFVFKHNPGLQHQILHSALSQIPVIGTQLKTVHTLNGSGIGLAVGVIGTLYGSQGVVQSAQNAMNSVWNIPYIKRPNFYKQRLRGLALIGLLGTATLLSAVLGIFAAAVAHGRGATLLAFVGSSVVMFGVFLAAFRVLTAEPLGWRDVLLGAVFATLFWQGLQLIGGWYVGRVLRNASVTYGFFATVIALLSWVLLGVQTTLYAAEINVVYRYRLWPRSMVQPPLTDADRATYTRLARMEVRRPEMELDVTYIEPTDRDPTKVRPLNSQDEEAGPSTNPS